MRRRILLLPTLAILTSACARAGAEPKHAPNRSATQYIVGIDISGSRTASQLHDEEEIIQRLIQRMEWGDRLILIETYRTGIDSAGQWQDSIPFPRNANRITGYDRNNLEQFRVVASQMASTFFDAEKSKLIGSTDLLHTLSRAADYATAANGRKTTVLLLSDMLQSTTEVNMERAGGIPDDAWIDERKTEGRLPSLHDVCVFVVGADPTSRKGARVRQFWQHYFQATNADYSPSNYRNMVADAAEISCESKDVRSSGR
jgi:hypothetical protein